MLGYYCCFCIIAMYNVNDSVIRKLLCLNVIPRTTYLYKLADDFYCQLCK